MKRVFANPKQEPNDDNSSKQLDSGIYKISRPDGYSLSNINPTEFSLNRVMNDKERQRLNAGSLETLNSSNEDIRVDVSLRTPLSFSPSILLVFSVDENVITGDSTSGTSLASKSNTSRQIMLNIDIGVNADICVSQVSGLWLGYDDDDDDDDDGRDQANTKFRKQIAKVLEVCEDLGMLVEWILRWLRKNHEG